MAFMARVDDFRFGSVVIDGKKYSRDVLIFVDGTARKRKSRNWPKPILRQ
jgi:hypothetical protein